MEKGIELLVGIKDLSNIKFEETELPAADTLKENEVLFAIDHFSFTSNNITYAAIGEEMHYWNFFPAAEGWGKVPCWGFGDVVLSKHPKVKEGERYYGYFPMASHLTVTADSVHPGGFFDSASHRRPLPSVYNHYLKTSADPTYKATMEARHMIFQPLFATSFLLEDYLVEQDYFGAEEMILTSASSKTAIALAFLLHQRKPSLNKELIITGLTSAKNRAFVESLGYYDKVITYDELEDLVSAHSSMVVDFAGNKALLMDLQRLLGDHLKYISFIGISHREDRSGAGSITVASSFFFAPTQATKRSRDWGQDGLQRKMAEQWFPFLKASVEWLEVIEGRGTEAVEKVYADMLAGKVNPGEGHILTLL